MNKKLCVLGLGYVGLPLSVAFGKHLDVVGYDIDTLRVAELKRGNDRTLEMTSTQMSKATRLTFSSDLQDIKDCTIFLVTVPTPIDSNNLPDLTPLLMVSKIIGSILKKGDIVIYESTVFPGCTEGECVPVLSAASGLIYNTDFFCGYSPERINPGDKINRLENIKKITSGSTYDVAIEVDELYRLIIKAGTYKAESIKVAEAAKITENIQRDVNIALINELHQVFSMLGINTKSVIEAASTKWNFMKLSPGLVGGHCISVDPYYLISKAQKSGYILDLVRSAREINNSMPQYLANDFLNNLVRRKINPVNLKVVILGFTFKENCPDIRNTKVVYLYQSLVQCGFKVEVFDPVADKKSVLEQYGLTLVEASAVTSRVAILAVGHEEVIGLCENVGFDYIYDFKGVLN